MYKFIPEFTHQIFSSSLSIQKSLQKQVVENKIISEAKFAPKNMNQDPRGLEDISYENI